MGTAVSPPEDVGPADGLPHSTQTRTVASSSSISTRLWPGVERAQDLAEGGAAVVLPASPVLADRPIVPERRTSPSGRFTDTFARLFAFSTIRTRNHVGAPLRGGAAASARGGERLLGRRARLGHREEPTAFFTELEIVLGTVGGGGRRERRHASGQPREQARLHGSSYSIQTWMRSPSSPSIVRISAGPVFLSRSQNVRAS